MAIPDYQTLMLPVLRLAADGEQRVAAVADHVADEFHLTQQERETLLPSGRQRLLNNRIHWAKFYLSKAGLISSPGRGRFVATEEGRKLLASGPDQINVALLMKYPSFRDFHRNEREPSAEGEEILLDTKVTKNRDDNAGGADRDSLSSGSVSVAGRPPRPHRSEHAIVLRTTYRRSACRDGVRRLAQERGISTWAVGGRRRGRRHQ